MQIFQLPHTDTPKHKFHRNYSRYCTHRYLHSNIFLDWLSEQASSVVQHEAAALRGECACAA